MIRVTGRNAEGMETFLIERFIVLMQLRDKHAMLLDSCYWINSDSGRIYIDYRLCSSDE